MLHISIKIKSGALGAASGARGGPHDAKKGARHQPFAGEGPEQPGSKRYGSGLREKHDFMREINAKMGCPRP